MLILACALGGLRHRAALLAQMYSNFYRVILHFSSPQVPWCSAQGWQLALQSTACAQFSGSCHRFLFSLACGMVQIEQNLALTKWE